MSAMSTGVSITSKLLVKPLLKAGGAQKQVLLWSWSVTKFALMPLGYLFESPKMRKQLSPGEYETIHSASLELKTNSMPPPEHVFGIR